MSCVSFRCGFHVSQLTHTCSAFPFMSLYLCVKSFFGPLDPSNLTDLYTHTLFKSKIKWILTLVGCQTLSSLKQTAGSWQQPTWPARLELLACLFDSDVAQLLKARTHHHIAAKPKTQHFDVVIYFTISTRWLIKPSGFKAVKKVAHLWMKFGTESCYGQQKQLQEEKKQIRHVFILVWGKTVETH